MRIVVLVKQVPDTYGERALDPATGKVDRVSGDQVIDEICERALEVALAAKDADKSIEVTVMTMGPADATGALRKALSMGADAAVHIVDDGLAGADLVATGTVLAAALRRDGFDLVITGNESTDGRGGMLAAYLGAVLGVPSLTALGTVSIDAATVSGTRTTDAARTSAHAALPAVISITEALPDARFPSFKGIMGAKRKPLTTVSLAELGVELPAAASVVKSTTARPARAAGTKITDEGDAGVKLAEYLAAEHLI